jgi:hypothetical protein
LLKIKYPSEFPRTQRSIKDISVFKANEYRNLIFYSFIYVLKPCLKTKYYNHLLIYALFLRILTQDSISDSDIEYSRMLIDQFMRIFVNSYHEKHLSFNLHAHVHLPNQVELFGPLNKISCFSFEGVFKICKNLFNGTRGISNQIANNLNISSYIYFNSAKLTENITNRQLKQLLKKTSVNNSLKVEENGLISPIDEINIQDVCKEHIALFGDTNLIRLIRTSLKASVHSFGKFKVHLAFQS